MPRAASLRTYFVLRPPDLEAARDRGAELDELVVEERHPHLERMRHRGAVEVVEHVVDERELRVEIQRLRERIAVEPGGEGVDRTKCRGAVERRALTNQAPRCPGSTRPLIARSRSAGVGAASAAADRTSAGDQRARPVLQRAPVCAPVPDGRGAMPHDACDTRRAARPRPGPRAQR